MSFDPFEHMAGTLAAPAPARSWLTSGDAPDMPAGSTRTAAMLALLATGPQQAPALAAAAGGIRTALVGAILKAHIGRGQVRCAGGWYELVLEWQEDLRNELKRAAALLRAHGYEVTRKDMQ